MNTLSRIAIAAALVAGLGSAAQAQTRPAAPAASDYFAVTEGRSVAFDRQVPQYTPAPVPASVSHTVMGLSTPY